MRFRIPNTVCLVLLVVLGLFSCKKDNSPTVTRQLDLPAGSDAVISASNGNFNRPGGTVNVPFMSGQMTLRVCLAPSFKLVELPYGGGKSYDMWLALPNGSMDTRSMI